MLILNVYQSYLNYFEEQYGLKPHETYCGIENLSELLSLRRDYLNPDCEIYKMLTKKERDNILKCFKIITFDEFIEFRPITSLKNSLPVYTWTCLTQYGQLPTMLGQK